MLFFRRHPRPGLLFSARQILDRCRNLWRYGILHTLLLSSILVILSTGTNLTYATPFPQYKAIENNTVFWEKVYGTYTSRQGILHDRDDLSIIYTVIDLMDWEAPGSGRVNRTLIKLTKKKIKQILFDLGHGKKPSSEEEKKIAALFPRKRHTTYLKARENIRLQIGQKDRFHKGVIRSGKYIKSIRTILKSHGLPTELAYLPHVESSFNPRAGSKAGATGLWQITRGTGRQYLTMNALVDERLDPQRSTHAAARLLKKNFEQLNNWPMAITAYNYGLAGMLRAKREHKDYVEIFNNYSKGYFKFASRNFYSEFLAALNTAKRLEKNTILQQTAPIPYRTITMKGYASAKEIQAFFRISDTDFKRYNPALKKPVLSGDKFIPKGYRLRLPATNLVRSKLGRFNDSFYYPHQKPDSYHIVRKGDTVVVLAKKYKTTVNTLKQLNNLNKHATIRVGQKLALPRTSRYIPILKGAFKTKATL